MKNYINLRKKLIAYRIVFIVFGIFFLFLAETILFRSCGGQLSLLFDLSSDPRWLVGGAAIGLGLTSLFIGCHLRTERELVRHITKNGKSAS